MLKFKKLDLIPAYQKFLNKRLVGDLHQIPSCYKRLLLAMKDLRTFYLRLLDLDNTGNGGKKADSSTIKPFHCDLRRFLKEDLTLSNDIVRRLVENADNLLFDDFIIFLQDCPRKKEFMNLVNSCHKLKADPTPVA